MSKADGFTSTIFIILLLLSIYGTIIIYNNEVNEIDNEIEQEYIDKMVIYNKCISKNDENKISACLQYYDISNYMQYDRDLYEVSVNDYLVERKEALIFDKNFIWFIGIFFIGILGNVVFCGAVVLGVFEFLEKKHEKWSKKREIKNRHYCVSCGDKV